MPKKKASSTKATTIWCTSRRPCWHLRPTSPHRPPHRPCRCDERPSRRYTARHPARTSCRSTSPCTPRHAEDEQRRAAASRTERFRRLVWRSEACLLKSAPLSLQESSSRRLAARILTGQRGSISKDERPPLTEIGLERDPGVLCQASFHSLRAMEKKYASLLEVPSISRESTKPRHSTYGIFTYIGVVSGVDADCTAACRALQLSLHREQRSSKSFR